jgi:hypothetical protein
MDINIPDRRVRAVSLALSPGVRRAALRGEAAISANYSDSGS